MQKIPQLTDFTIKLRFRDSEGNPIPIPQDLQLSYFTQCSTPILFSYDGTDTPLCRATDNGTALLLIFDNPRLSTGQLMVKRSFSIPSSLYPDAKRDLNQTDCLPIFIVVSLNDIIHPPKEPNDPTFEEIVYVEVGAKGDKGDKGEKGEKGEKGDNGDSLDYSILTEQIAPGEFALAPDGSRKQVYTRTVKIEYPAGYGTGTIFDGLTLTPAFNNVQGFVSVNGFFYFNIGKPLYRVATLENQAVNPFIFGSSGRNVFALYSGATIAEPSVAIVQVKYYKF